MKNLKTSLLILPAISLGMAANADSTSFGIGNTLADASACNSILRPVIIQEAGNICTSETPKRHDTSVSYNNHGASFPELLATDATRFPIQYRQGTQSKERLDSIITLVNSTGEPYMAAFYEYDERNLPKSQHNCYWNPQSNEWDVAEQYGYDWNKDGFCLYQWQINTMYSTGIKYEYEYNADNLGTSRTEYTWVDNEWIPNTRNLYVYDSNGFVAEEFLKYYDQSTLQWNDYMWNKVEYDRYGRTIHWEGYVWDGTAWTPYAEKQDITYDSDGNVNTVWFQRWMKSNAEWMNYYQVVNTYEDNVIMSQEHRFWNRELSSWVGRDDFDTGFPCTNLKSIFEYDSKGRMISETVYHGLTTEGYTKAVAEEFVYSPMEDGGTELVDNTYYYEEDESSRESRNLRIKHFNAADSLTYSFQAVYENEAWINRSEEVRTYYENNLLKSSKSYTFSYTPDNKKFAGISIDYLYDEDNNLKEKYYMVGLGTAEDDWYYTTHYEYNYELGNIQVDELCSKWDGTHFIPRNGDGWRYDYDTPVSDLILWAGALPEYKILERRVYVNNPENNEWDYYCYYHHYSTQEVTTGISDKSCDNSNALSVNEDGSILYVNSDRGMANVSVYSANGGIVFSGHTDRADLSHLPSGLYVARTGGETLKFIKK